MGRWLRALAHVHVSALVFVASLLAGAVVHVRALPIGHRLVLALTERTLENLLSGRIVLRRIEDLGWNGIVGLDAEAYDPDGVLVVRARGIHANISTLTLVRSLLTGGRTLRVDLPEIAIDDSDVLVEQDASGQVRIARAFLPRAATSDNGSGPGVFVSLHHVHFTHAVVHGQPSPQSSCDVRDADATLFLTPANLVIDMARGALAARGLPGDLAAEGRGVGHLEKPPNGELRLEASLDGSAFTLPLKVALSLSGEDLNVGADVGPASGERMRSVLPPWPFATDTAVHAEAHGRAPVLAVSAHAAVAGGTLDAQGTTTIGPAVKTEARLSMGHVEGSALAAPQPCAIGEGHGDGTLTIEPTGGLEARLTFAIADAACGPTGLPAATIAAEVRRAASGETSGRADVQIHEPAAPALVSLRVAPSGPHTVLSFDANAAAARLENERRLPQGIAGDALAVASGSLDLTTWQLDASASVTTRGITAQGVALGAGSVTALAHGPLGAPRVALHAAIDGLSAGLVHIPPFETSATWDASTSGDASSLRAVVVTTAAKPPGKTPSDGTEVFPVKARAQAVHFGGGVLEIDGAVVEGLGEPIDARLRLKAGELGLRAKCNGFDLARAASLTTIPFGAGSVALDVDLSANAAALEGHANLDLSRGAFLGLDEVSAHLDAEARGRKLRGEATLAAQGVGAAALRTSSLEAGPGSLFGSMAWRRAFGQLGLQAHVDLGGAAAHGLLGPLHSADVGGLIDVVGQLSRDDLKDVTPAIDVRARTTGLTLSGRTGGPGWTLAGVEPEVRVLVDGTTGDTEVTAGVADERGLLATLDVRSGALPYERFVSGADFRDVLASIPFGAHLEVPTRGLDTYPSALGLASAAGELHASVDWTGSALAPSVNASATLTHGLVSPDLLGRRVDASMTARYDGAHLDVAADGVLRRHRVVQALARADLQAADVLEAFAGAPLPWTGEGRIRLDALPLATVTALDERQVRGTVSGEVAVLGLHDDARATASLALDKLQVGDVACREGRVEVRLGQGALQGSVHLVEDDGGTLDAAAQLGAPWGASLLPSFDPGRPAQGALSAHHFRAALLGPFIGGSVTTLDGRIDANAHAILGPGAQGLRFEGNAALSDGTFELADLGGEFHNVSANMTLNPDGVIRIENFVAHGITGEVQGSATGRVAGLSLASARAIIQMPPQAPLPLVYSGVQLGLLDGRFDLSLAKKDHAIAVDVQVPSLHLDLPSVTGTRDVQALGDLDAVRVGIELTPGDFVDTPLDGAKDVVDPSASSRIPITVAVHLDGGAQVTRGADLDVRLDGTPTITIAREVTMAGQVRLLRGTLDVLGKPFVIENGTITFVGPEPTNPQVVLTASWGAADGTRVFADFVGPLKTGKVTLRSEPARPQNEILALVLFGTADTVGNAASGNTTPELSGVAGAAGGVATQPINRALSGVNRAFDRIGLTGGGISTKIDTSTTNLRPEVEVQIARDISVQVAWVLGAIPPGTNPDTTLFTVSWNFLKQWSLEATRGDAGTSILDFVWQHRY